MNNDRSDDSDDSEGYSERIKLGEAVDEQAMGHKEIVTRTMVPLQTLLKNEKEGCSVFHGFCSEKGIWEYGELELVQLFSIENQHSMVRSTLQNVFWWDFRMMTRNWSKESREELVRDLVIGLLNN